MQQEGEEEEEDLIENWKKQIALSSGQKLQEANVAEMQGER